MGDNQNQSKTQQNRVPLFKWCNEVLERSDWFKLLDKFQPGVLLGILVAVAGLLINNYYRNEEKTQHARKVLGAVALNGENKTPMNPVEVAQAIEFLVSKHKNLGAVELGRVKLSGLRLPPGTDLSNVRMSGGFNERKEDHAELLNSTLRHVDFSNANLYRIDFSGELTDLTGAIFRGASMEKAVFKQARIDGTDFCGAELQYAVFNHARGTNPLFSHAKLAEADFEHANLPDARFDHAQLRKAKFWSAELPNANFNSADLTDAVFSDATLSGATFRDADLRGATLDGAILKDVEFEGARVKGKNWLGDNEVDETIWEVRATLDDDGNEVFRVYRRAQDEE